jgi:hypothetical protein
VVAEPQERLPLVALVTSWYLEEVLLEEVLQVVMDQLLVIVEVVLMADLAISTEEMVVEKISVVVAVVREAVPNQRGSFH